MASQEDERPTKKKKTKRKNIFVDDEVQETRSRKKKDKGPPKTQDWERKKMDAAKIEIPKLLKLLCDDTAPTCEDHYEWPDHDCIRKVAQALKWAYTPEAEDNKDPEYRCPGREVFWQWWSTPMENPNNKTWRKHFKCDEEDKCTNVWQRHKEEVDELINERKALWYSIYGEARANGGQLDFLRGWVTHILRRRKILVNPGSTDMHLGQLAQDYLSLKFILIDQTGASIQWDEKEKLWIRREKDRSPAVLGSSLMSLVGDRIIFTDAKAEEKFMGRVQNNGSLANVLHWWKSQIPFQGPAPIKEVLNRDKWSLPLLDGKICDMKTLTVRDRVATDLFTTTTNFRWFVDRPDTTIDKMTMDLKAIEEFKEKVSLNEPCIGALFECCPNAVKFVGGPFKDYDRMDFFIKNLGIAMSTHCSRKCMWIFGDGKGMKSTFMLAVVKAMGNFAVVANKKVFFKSGDDASSGHNTDVMRCEGKRLILVDELDKKDVLKETLYKTFAAHGQISAREIYGGQGEWPAAGYVTLISNVVIPLNFDNASIADRTLPIRGMTRVFNPSDPLQSKPPHFRDIESWVDGPEPDEKDDKKNPHKTYWVLKNTDEEAWAARFLIPGAESGLMDELGCFLLLCGYYAYHQLQLPGTGGELKVPEVVQEDYKVFLKESDHVGQYIAENLDVDKTARCKLKDIYKDYKEWCTSQGMKAVQLKSLKENLSQKGLIVYEKPEYYSQKEKRMKKSSTTLAMVKVFIKAALEMYQIDDPLLDGTGFSSLQ